MTAGASQSALAGLPTAQEVEGWAKLVAPVLALGGLVGGAAVRAWRWRRRRLEERERDHKAIVQAYDALAHLLNMVCPGPDGRWTDQQKLQRQMWLVMEMREALFRADGYVPPEDRPAAVVQDWLRRTQAIAKYRPKEGE